MEALGLNFADWFILIVLIASGLISFARGFTKEFLSLFLWLVSFIAEISLEYLATPKINEFIGNNLTQISNEIEKLVEIKKDDKKITLDDIQKYIGVSKEYNNFELRKAIAEKNKDRALHIAQFFSKNSSLNPLVLTTSIIFDFFKKLLIYHSIKSKDEKVIATKLKISPYFLSEFSVASKNYSLKDTVKVISIIRDFDMYSKGLYIKKINPKLIEEFVIRILAD